MDVDVLSHFGLLDELIQVIYQGVERFIILSTVTESSWVVHVTLKGPEGRWWRGSWSACDISQFLGATPSSNTLASFAHSLCGAFVDGELCIGGWTPERGTAISLTLRPTSKKPVQIPLVELSASEAASHATTIFCGIALQAQARKCQLNPPAFSAQTIAAAGPSRTRHVADAGSAPTRAHVAKSASKPHAGDETEAQQRIRSLEVELERVKAQKAKLAKSESPPVESEPKPSASARRPKGASLANPHKKARKYEAVEFESD